MAFQKVPGFVFTNSCDESKDIICMDSPLKRFRNILAQGVTFFNISTDSFTSWFFFHKNKDTC